MDIDLDLDEVFNQIEAMSTDEFEKLLKEIKNKTPIRLIYPTNFDKYYGSIFERNNRFEVKITKNNLNLTKSRTFGSYDESYNFVINFNKRNPHLIKNLIEEYDDYLRVHLTKNKYMICDKNDIDLIQKHFWYAVVRKDGLSYATTTIRGKSIKYHNVIMNHTPGELTVDHINRNSLDNRKQNLRLATAVEQAKNRNYFNKVNKTGMLGVEKEEGKYARYYAVWSANGKQCKKSFSINKYGEQAALQMAIECRKLHE